MGNREFDTPLCPFSIRQFSVDKVAIPHPDLCFGEPRGAIR